MVSLTLEASKGWLEGGVWKQRVFVCFLEQVTECWTVSQWQRCVSVSKSSAQGKQHEAITRLLKAGDSDRWRVRLIPQPGIARLLSPAEEDSETT